MEKQQAAVREFHRKFGVSERETPGFPTPEIVRLRLALIEEEHKELRMAVAARNLIGTADAFADLLYVVLGAAISFGIDLEPVFEEVHRTNMNKTGGARRGDGKILKPPGWKGPQVRAILVHQGAQLP